MPPSNLEMLAKIDSGMIRQPNPARHRRWWRSPEADLLVDVDRETGEVVSFELDWETADELRPYVRWGRAIGLSTGRMDTGDRLGALTYKQTPIVFLDKILASSILQEAKALLENCGLPDPLREEILSRLRE